MEHDIKDLQPTKYFDLPPYSVEEFPGIFPDKKWYAVVNKNGFNCLNFPQKPGLKFTLDKEYALAICEAWNNPDSKGSNDMEHEIAQLRHLYANLVHKV